MADSNVGESRIYEAGDQRNYSKNETRPDEASKFEEGKDNSHSNLDSKDERSLANKLAHEAKKSKEDSDDAPPTKEAEWSQQDARKPALMHGNEPSKGAKIDQQLREEEEEILKKKGDFGPRAAN